MICSTCASPAEVGERFCSNCGSPFSAQLAQMEESLTPPSVIEGTTRRLEGVSPPWMAGAESAQTAASAKGILSKIQRYTIGASLTLAILLLAVMIGFYFLPGRVLPRRVLPSHVNQVDSNSLAVIPFNCCGPPSENISARISENVRNSLAQLPQLKVIAPGHGFNLRYPDGDPMRMGRELGVRVVLMVRVEQVGDDDFLINAELIDTRDRRLLWGEQYHRHMEDLQKTQVEISRNITEKLKQLLPLDQQ